MPTRPPILPRTARVVVALFLLACPATAGALDLDGEWYVLVHFEERALDSTDPTETVQAGIDYRDFVWRFERRGDALRWTVFPDIRFEDETGRYEDLRGARARLRHAWRPSVGQVAEIRAGLALDEQTARAKRLRRSGAHAYESGASARPGSASSVAFGERWEVARLDAAPVFTLAASLSSGRTDRLDGATRFTADRVDADAGRIEGRYDRDGTATGRFFMWRKGDAHPGDAAFAAAEADASLLGPGGAARSSVASLQALLDRLDEPGAREDVALRTDIREAITSLVEDAYARQARSLRRHRLEVDALVDEIERLCVVEGVPLDEIDRRFEAGALSP